MTPRPWASGALLAAAAIVAGGCGSSPPVGLHVLSPPPQEAAAARFALSVGVGPVTVPEYLDRLQVVSRNASGGIAVSDIQRWAEPPPEGLARALSASLSGLLGTGRVVVFPWAPSRAPDLQVPVEVLRFEAGPDGTVRLEARWSVKRANGAPLLGPQQASLAVPGGSDVDARIRAHGEAAARLARSIATGLRESAPP